MPTTRQPVVAAPDVTPGIIDQSAIVVASKTSMADNNVNNNNSPHVDLSNALVSMVKTIQTSSQNDSGLKQSKFAITDNADHWLDMYTTYADIKSWNDETRARSFPFYLEEEAKNWFHTVTPDVKSDWTKLSSYFLASHTLTKPQKFAKLQTLLKRQQQASESVATFLAYISKECNKISRSDEQTMELALQG